MVFDHFGSEKNSEKLNFQDFNNSKKKSKKIKVRQNCFVLVLLLGLFCIKKIISKLLTSISLSNLSNLSNGANQRLAGHTS